MGYFWLFLIKLEIRGLKWAGLVGLHRDERREIRLLVNISLFRGLGDKEGTK